MVSTLPKPHSAATASTGVAVASSAMHARSTRSALDVGGGGRAGLAAEGALEVPLAHLRALGQAGDAQVLAEMAGDPALELAQRIARRRPAARPRAELGLAAGALQEHDELARDPQRDVGAEVVRHERQREVDPRGDAGRRPDVAVADPDRLGIDRDRRVAARQRVAPGPVGGRAAAVEQPAAARTNAPVQTEATRRARGAAART